MKNITTRILVVEDDPQYQELYNIMLTQFGYEVLTASDGKQGFEIYRRDLPDLVITDLIMPEKEGIEFITELKAEFPDSKIIAVSGGGRYEPETYLSIAEGLGADKTFPKPFEWSELNSAIQGML